MPPSEVTLAECLKTAGYQTGAVIAAPVLEKSFGLQQGFEHYDDEGLLHHVGFSSSFNARFREELTPMLEKLRKPPGFTGRAPGGPSRWSTERSAEWEPLEPKLVVEVQYDHFTNGRFRHGTKFMRWRPDKDPRTCTMDQVMKMKAPVRRTEESEG